MKINRNELLQALAKVKPGLSSKGIIEQANHFIFTKEGIATYNDFICINFPFKTDLQCSIKADEFYKLLQSMQDEMILIACDKDMKVKINGKATRAGLSAIKEGTIAESIDQLNLVSIKTWKALPENFIEGVKLCMFSISKDVTSGALSSLCVNDGKIVSSDNLRISQFDIDEFKGKALIPLQAVIELVKYEVKKYHIADSWIHFKTDDDLIFSARLMKGDFPDVSELLNLKGNKIAFPKELKEALKLIKVVVEDSMDVVDQKISIAISKNKITCRGEGNIGWAEQDIDCEYKGKDIHFLMNPIFLMDILSRTQEMIIGDGKALFVVDQFKHIMVLPE